MTACAKEEILALSPQIDVTPEKLDFGWALVEQMNQLPLTIKNSGAAVLDISDVYVEPASAVHFSAGQFPSTMSPGEEIELDVFFRPEMPRAIYSAKLIIESNDRLNERLEIPLDGRGGYREIKVVPREIDFGVVDEGAGYQQEVLIENVGEEPLEITEIVWTSTSSDLGPANRFSSQQIIEARTSTSVFILYDPIDLYGDRGQLLIRSNDELEPEIIIPVQGYGNLAPRAIAWGCQTVFQQIGCAGQDTGRRFTMSVGQRIGLDGRESFDPEGKGIQSFRWEIVAAPENSSSLVFHTSDDIQMRKKATGDFEVNNVGRYELRLIVTDERGVQSLDRPESRIVLAPKDLQVLLKWDVTTDVDLHIVEPGGQLGSYGTGDIGTSTGSDCSWANRGPNWNDLSSALDDPRLDIDAVSSKGPEITSINDPVSGGAYKVYAHYCDSRSVGEEIGLTMELYVEGELVETIVSTDLGVKLSSGQVWEIGSILWEPSGQPRGSFSSPTNASVTDRPELCLTRP